MRGVSEVGGMTQQQTLQRMLVRLGIPREGVLLVHSAFKGFAREGYDPLTVLQVLADYMHPGTLLMPTMSWRYVKPNHPYFNELTTPSNTGILTEIFRQRYATYRSLHPTHSVSGMGKNLPDILGTHAHCVTPCGADSPFAKLIHYDASILMLGVGVDCCTLIHHVEEMVAPDYYVRSVRDIESYSCQDRSGKVATVHLRRHLFLPRNYWQFQDELARQGELVVFRCDNAICLGFSARKLYHRVNDVLQKCPDAIIAKPGQRYRLM
ncbi:MAG: hypothetical protein A3F41_07295 [Coxiella sp. RIFCSPHIGHO2_12_FULL_44_14]|nr:MAG: hypothetical protein A3F41_07295 [Coxiella sp. RIFCSPHIGHO2_12_FULL_44_14]